MTPANDTPRSLEERLLQQPRPTAGIDTHRQPVRLGERDTDGHIVGYIDDDGLAWQSLAERIVAERAGHLFDALKLHPDHPQRDRLIEHALADMPDELIGDLARAAGRNARPARPRRRLRVVA
jgi:hypothetical protein